MPKHFCDREALIQADSDFYIGRRDGDGDSWMSSRNVCKEEVIDQMRWA